MKILLLATVMMLGNLAVRSQDIIKMYIYTETEHTFTHQNEGTGDWKPGVVYKGYIRLVTEIFDIPRDFKYDDFRKQFYEFLMTKYPEEMEKMRGHRGELRLSAIVHDDANPNTKGEYAQLFKKDPRDSWHFETIVVKGFTFDPAKQGPLSPLAKKAEALIKGL